MFYNLGDNRNDPVYNKGNFNSNTYNPNARWNHPNFKWRNDNDNTNQYQNSGNQYQNRPNQYQRPPQNDQNSELKKIIEGLVIQQNDFMNHQRAINTDMSDQARNLSQKMELLTTQVRMIETQIAQQASLSSRQQGTLPGKPDINPREQAHAVTLRNGKEYEGPKVPEEGEQNVTQSETIVTPKEPIANPTNLDNLQNNGNSVPNKGKAPEIPKYIPPHRFVPFPQRLVKHKLDQQYAKFVEHLKKLNITIPFTETITQMPTYAKFLKEILTNKRTIEEVGTVSLNEECSALFSNKLPPKLKDPGSFVIPCKIGDTKFNRCLCDLGASVSLMPKSIYKRLNLIELKATRMSLQLADKSVRFPEGIVEDVIVQIGEYFVPVDFVVVEMEEDTHTPLLLGRDFLITAGANIDVKEGKISFDIGGEKVDFHMFESIKYPSNSNDSICRVDILDSIIAAHIEVDDVNEQLEQILEETGSEDEQNDEKFLSAGRTATNGGRTEISESQEGEIFSKNEENFISAGRTAIKEGRTKNRQLTGEEVRQECDLHQTHCGPHPGEKGQCEPHQLQFDPHLCQFGQHLHCELHCDPHHTQCGPHPGEKAQFDPHQPQYGPHQGGKIQIEGNSSDSKPPKVELKPLPPSLRYEYLGTDNTYPVIVNAELNKDETDKPREIEKKKSKEKVDQKGASCGGMPFQPP
jgi:hypothetical protein